MNKGKMRFKLEIENFVNARLKYRPYYHEYSGRYFWHSIEYERSVEERLRHLDDMMEQPGSNLINTINFPQLTNHEICHEMFWNAFRGYSKLFVQIQDLRFDEYTFPDRSNDSFITLSCSLLTLQMLDYDLMMFRAMGNMQDEEYRNAAQQFYRPYLFSFVAEIDQEKYQTLRKLQRSLAGNQQNNEYKTFPYMWIACTFNPTINKPHVELDGYVVQSASNINKIRAKLMILEEEMDDKTIKSLLDGYQISRSCIKDDNTFIESLESKLDNRSISNIDVYKIGNGNCVFAQTASSGAGFFYDLGFNYKHRPEKLTSGKPYNYSKTMGEIAKKKPSFFILSHWHMDHIAGNAVAKKDWFEKDWFAPDCCDACTDAKRLAKYIDLKGHLHLAKRCPRGSWTGGLIGRQITIKSSSPSSKVLATYNLYMGQKAGCDSSYPNCEGIVLEFTDKKDNKKVMMMGDVNYTSFNLIPAIAPLSFAKIQIDYLIAPHHGSEHTGYKGITDGEPVVRKGKQAIICCTNVSADNRPNGEHLKELKKRFETVVTTEEASDVSISISV